MGGFALRAADTPRELPAVARIAPGGPAARRPARGEAMGIATGGVVPEGADAVVPIELVTEEGDRLTVSEPVPAGANLRPRGGDVHAGDSVVAGGALLHPHHLAALLAAGIGSLRVGARPPGALLAAGTGLRPAGAPAPAGAGSESSGPGPAAEAPPARGP